MMRHTNISWRMFGERGWKGEVCVSEMTTEKQSTRLEQELQEADPGKGEGSVRQS